MHQMIHFLIECHICDTSACTIMLSSVTWVTLPLRLCLYACVCVLRAAREWRATTWLTAGQDSLWWWKTATPNTTSTSPATALTASMWCRRVAASRPSTAYRRCTGRGACRRTPCSSHKKKVLKAVSHQAFFYWGRKNLRLEEHLVQVQQTFVHLDDYICNHSYINAMSLED